MNALPQGDDTLIWRHAHVFTLDTPGQWGEIQDAAIVTRLGRIAWIGADGAWPCEYNAYPDHDVQGALLTPGLIDPHTHLVYAGHRAHEFELRLEGATYEEIARAGGGIRSTVSATRTADESALLALAVKRARAWIAQGVTTLEVKSGYGLSQEHEARCLRVARRLAEVLPIEVRTTSLGAHALPPEFADRADDYIEEVCRWLPGQQREGLVDAVDVFCDRIGFTPAQTERVFAAAQALGLPVKLHAEQLSNQEGAALAARFGALSCDHLEHLSEAGIAALARSGTVAVLLPAAYYFLRDTQLPPVQGLRQAGVPMALATDHNPGSAPGLSVLLMLNMACTLFRLTPLEAWQGITLHAARALGLDDRGRLATECRADMAVWDADHPRELAYQFGHNPCLYSVLAGKRRSLHP